MTQFVMIRHESQDESVEPAKTSVEAYETYYVHKGWKVVDDAPVNARAVEVTSLSVEEQVNLLQSDPDKLTEALSPVDSTEEAHAVQAEAEKAAKTSTRGGKS